MGNKAKKSALFVHGLGGLGRGAQKGLEFGYMIAQNEMERVRAEEKKRLDESQHRDSLRMQAIKQTQDQQYPDPDNPKRTITIKGTSVDSINSAFPGKTPLLPADFQSGAKGRPMSGAGGDASRENAETRREKNFLVNQFEQQSRDFKESVDAYSRAKANYDESTKAPNTASDKNLVLNYISAEQGNRITDRDYLLGAQQGTIPQQWQNWYSMAVKGSMTPDVRNQIIGAVRASVRGREQLWKARVENEYTERSQRLGINPKDVVRNLRPVDWNVEFEKVIQDDNDAMQIIQKGQTASPDEIKALIEYRNRKKAGK